ncbi:uncharacterized protein LOC142532777 [Primulina tabacum]|uniref:uncharacterized protein LOC142532777 n=1 Tax=Primulina tabacum TaxID=48773 RepID=UPI003F59AB7F
MEVAKGVQRWVVDISKWKPSVNHLSFFISLLPQHEHSSINRFVKLEDKKRALVSRLLQYALVHQILGIPFDEIIILRTVEGKPYLVCENTEIGFPNFNFNASHHGDYVAIASEPLCLVGLDIVSHSIPTNETAQEFIQNFSAYFSSLEWYHIISGGSSDEKLKIFYRYWCLKEAYVKALGTGVGYRLDDVEFHHTGWKNISAKVAGIELKDWKFWLLELDQLHSLSIARGHPRTAISSYKSTLKQTEFDKDVYNMGLHLPNSSFIFLTVEDLVPVQRKLDRLSLDLSRNHLEFKTGDYEEEARFSEL